MTLDKDLQRSQSLCLRETLIKQMPSVKLGALFQKISYILQKRKTEGESLQRQNSGEQHC